MSGNLTFTHTEYIRDVQSSTAFKILKLPINPGLSILFPFLSQLASNYEQYQFRQLSFTYKSTSATALNSTNTALGTVIFGVNYDVLAPNWVSKFEMNNYNGTKSVSPSQSMALGIGPAAYPILYVRSGTPPADADLRLYDHANFFIATEGSQAESDIGELWVTYSVVLFKPKLHDALGWDTGTVLWFNNTGIDGANPMGTGSGVITAASMPAYAGSSGVAPLLPPGIWIAPDNRGIRFGNQYSGCSFIILANWHSGSGQTWTIPNVGLGNMTLKPLWANFYTQYQGSAAYPAGTLNAFFGWSIALDPTEPANGHLFTFNQNGTLPNAIGLSLTIIQVPPFTAANAFDS